MFDFRNKIDDQEWRFLLTGGVALENPFPNPASDWLTDKSWSEIVRASDVPAFKGFMDHFQKKVSHLFQDCFIKLPPHTCDRISLFCRYST